MFKKAKYPVYVCTDATIEIYSEQEYDTDDYGSSITRTVYKERSFMSPLYWISEQDSKATISSNKYLPVAPSGEYNERFSSLYGKHLKHLKKVGYFDGDKFDINIPFQYRSILELDVLDVFTLDCSYRNVATCFDTKAYTIHTSQRLILESFNDLPFSNKFSSGASVTDLDTGSTYKIYGDVAVQKIGKIRLVREFVEERLHKHVAPDHRPIWDTNSLFEFGWGCSVCGYQASEQEAKMLDEVMK